MNKKLFRGLEIVWKGKGVYALADPTKEHNWEKHWFKLDKMEHVETAMELGMAIAFVHECDTVEEQ